MSQTRGFEGGSLVALYGRQCVAYPGWGDCTCDVLSLDGKGRKYISVIPKWRVRRSWRRSSLI